MSLRDWITQKLVDYLTAPVGHYDRRVHNDLASLKRHIRKGDVLLVDGEQRVSAVIKHLTRSSWSHAALYVGDELVRRGGSLAEWAHAEFGDEAEHLMVEALFGGVVAAPLSKYIELNVRVCRPHRLQKSDLAVILGEAVGAIGWAYDLRNILDLARHFLVLTLTPGRARREAQRFGSGVTTEVMCSSLLGRLFHRVGFPVLPGLEASAPPAPAEPEPRGPKRLLGRSRAQPSPVLRRRHPTLLTPRDFDLSPYFEVVKFNVIAERGFDYQRIEWLDEPGGDEKLAS